MDCGVVAASGLYPYHVVFFTMRLSIVQTGLCISSLLEHGLIVKQFDFSLSTPEHIGIYRTMETTRNQANERRYTRIDCACLKMQPFTCR